MSNGNHTSPLPPSVPVPPLSVTRAFFFLFLSDVRSGLEFRIPDRGRASNTRKRFENKTRAPPIGNSAIPPRPARPGRGARFSLGQRARPSSAKTRAGNRRMVACPRGSAWRARASPSDAIAVERPPPPLFLRNGTLTSDRVRRNKSEMRATLFSPPGGTRRAGTRPGVAPFERFRRQDVIGRATTRPAPKTTPRVSPGQRRVAKLRATARYWKLGPYRSATATIRFSSSSFLYSRRDTYT